MPAKRSWCPARKPPAAPLDPARAARLVEIFRVFANPARLRLLHALLQAPERCVMELADEAEISVQAASNQLRSLADRRILSTRRQGQSIYYRIVDPCVPLLLEAGVCLLEDTGAARPHEDEPTIAMREAERAPGASA
ncbi:MAG: helix-turn-helix transcriptional regulator [Candidatus Schekmanbacteria bacterium]|nr:helix-turn-helix transcriptional regulator [Candidatus Schekmanbacteria bacterium]